MTTTKRPQYKTERVVKDDGTVVNICRCALEDTRTLLAIQDRLIKAYVDCDGAIGEIISDAEVQADLRSMCSLLPIEQKVKGEVQYLDFDDIKENWEQIVSLFFNGAINEETREVNEVHQSKVSALHFLPYQRLLREHLKTKEQENV